MMSAMQLSILGDTARSAGRRVSPAGGRELQHHPQIVADRLVGRFIMALGTRAADEVCQFLGPVAG
jgi:hypothetical protein